MQRIAHDRLLDLRKQQIIIAHDEIANALAPIGSGMELAFAGLPFPLSTRPSGSKTRPLHGGYVHIFRWLAYSFGVSLESRQMRKSVVLLAFLLLAACAKHA